MPFFKQRPRTAQQKAQRTQMRIIVRLACCVYLVFYVIVPMLKPQAEENTMNPVLRISIVAAFIAAVILIGVLTVREVIINWKAGLYKAAAYKDDPGVWGTAGADEIGEGEGEGEGDADDEDDEDDDDEDEDGDDDDYDDDDYDED